MYFCISVFLHGPAMTPGWQTYCKPPLQGRSQNKEIKGNRKTNKIKTTRTASRWCGNWWQASATSCQTGPMARALQRALKPSKEEN